MNTKRGRRRREALQYLWLLIYEINVELIILYKIHLMTNLTNLEVHTHGRPGVCNWLGEQGWVFKATHNRKQPTKVEFHVYRWQTLLLYFYRLSLNQTGTAIGWFLVTWPWLKSNVSRSWYIKQCTHSGYIAAHDQTMVESGVTEGGETLPVFFFVNEYNNTNTKP